MAYDKIIVLRKRMDHCINYVFNEEKTSLSSALDYAGNPKKTHRLITGINCQAETAHSEMQATKRRWDKRGGILGYHIIHSYAPGEVTAAEAHAAGVEFAHRLLGDRYEVVVSTHVDREHLHCHIVFNSVSFVDGKKYRSDFKSYFGDLRNTSNEVSRERGLSVIQSEGHGKHYAEWNAERCGKMTLSALVRQDVDAALADSFTFESFLGGMRRRGYEVKHGTGAKHTAVRPPEGKRFFRLDSLGEGYTETNIRARLMAGRNGEIGKPVEQTIHPKRYTVQRGTIWRTPRRPRGFRALYLHYLCLLGSKKQRKLPPFQLRKELIKLQRYQAQFRFLQEYRIQDSKQLALLGEALQTELDAWTEKRRVLYGKKRNGEEVTEEIARINQGLRYLRADLKTCAQIEADIPYIREQVRVGKEWQAEGYEKKYRESKRQFKPRQGTVR